MAAARNAAATMLINNITNIAETSQYTKLPKLLYLIYFNNIFTVQATLLWAVAVF